MALISLEEHNSLVHNQYSMFGKPRKNGIACPKCGKELWDSEPNVTYTSYPPQVKINCECGYTGFRSK